MEHPAAPAPQEPSAVRDFSQCHAAIVGHLAALDELPAPGSVAELTRCPSGLVLVTGPTGCGKTRFVAHMAARLEDRDLVGGMQERGGHEAGDPRAASFLCPAPGR